MTRPFNRHLFNGSGRHAALEEACGTHDILSALACVPELTLSTLLFSDQRTDSASLRRWDLLPKVLVLTNLLIPTDAETDGRDRPKAALQLVGRKADGQSGRLPR